MFRWYPSVEGIQIGIEVDAIEAAMRVAVNARRGAGSILNIYSREKRGRQRRGFTM